MDIKPAISPFWFTPPDQDEVRFKLKPLTQPQIAELWRTFVDSAPTMESFYKAGELALNGAGEIEGLTIDGKPARWPKDRNVIPYLLIVKCGVEILTQTSSLDGGDAEKN